MSALTLKQLRYFEAVVEHRHFRRAAEASAISQPALSMQIRELETALGTVLFERSARQVRLTPLGEEVALRAREILRAVDELADLARAAGGRLTGRLRIGVIPTIAPYLLPRLLGDLASLHPGLDLRLREGLTAMLIADLIAGRLDTAVVALPVSEPSLAEMPLFSEEFVLVRPRSEAAAPVPTPEALLGQRLLLLEEGHCFRDQALAFCQPQGRLPPNWVEGSSLATLVQMVSAGLGVTVIPEIAVAVETRSAEVAVARFAAPRPERTVGMVWRRTSPLAPQLAEIGEIVRGSAAGLRAT